MASASGSATSAPEDDTTDSDDDDDDDQRALDNWRRSVASVNGLGVGGASGEQLSELPSGYAGDQGRGGHVLVERKSSVPAASSHWTTRYVLDASSKRRSSPAARPSTPSKSRRNARHAPPERDPTPPLTLDHIQTSLNPFPLVQQHFRFRTSLVPEVIILTSALALALHRLDSVSPTITSLPPFPIPLFSVLPFLIPIIALFRDSDSYLKVPFTDERGYRSAAAADDGVAAALALPLLFASACLWETYSSLSKGTIGLEGARPIVDLWESAGIHASPPPALKPSTFDLAKALIASRTELVFFTALNSAVLLLHLALAKTVLRIERLPTGNTKRFFGFLMLSWSISTAIYFLALTFHLTMGPLPISPLEAALTTLIQQNSFYFVSRLARRGFTIGELNTMTSAGNALVLEFWRLSRSRWLYKRGHPMIPPTFRTPTALIVFQAVLIPGAFLSGFLLSPLLWPTERERHRRLLAVGVFLGLFGIVFFMLGGWAGWQLGGGLRRPWLWALAYVLSGGDGVYDGPAPTGWRRWKRLLLVAYWGGTIVVAVGGWQTRLVRARRIRMGPATTTASGEKRRESASHTPISAMAIVGAGAGARVENAREEKRVHASLNMRRKFFHALAVMMFVPGIAIDPAFTSLGFSVAFALFTFSEYARYFALYPVGAPLHIFFSEFVDNKDSGPVILSHFYLLTGCAGGLWLEGRGVNRFTGVLVLGVGDAMASVVGKLLGRTRWPGTVKTVEGTVAFVLSIIFSAWILRLTGLTDNFHLGRYTIATTLAALLEAFSAQNDNLIIPIYMWSVVSLLDCN